MVLWVVLRDIKSKYSVLAISELCECPIRMWIERKVKMKSIKKVVLASVLIIAMIAPISVLAASYDLAFDFTEEHYN